MVHNDGFAQAIEAFAESISLLEFSEDRGDAYAIVGDL
jgi:hypothetical protein